MNDNNQFIFILNVVQNYSFVVDDDEWTFLSCISSSYPALEQA